MDITAAIADQLEAIVPDATIYIENRPQGFDEPAFYIYEIKAYSADQLMDYQFRKHLYCVMYFPDATLKDPGVREQCESMRGKLMDEFLTIDGLSLKLLDREAAVNDGTLQFTFKLSFRVVRTDDNPSMQKLETEGGLKNG